MKKPTFVYGSLPFKYVQPGDIFIFLDKGVPLLFLCALDNKPDTPSHFIDSERFSVDWYDLQLRMTVRKFYKRSGFIMYAESKLIRNGEEVNVDKYLVDKVYSESMSE